MRSQNFNIITFGFVLTCWHFVSAASANTELSKMRDCTKIELEALIDQDASREDNLARLSERFFESVNKIEHCDREQDSVDAASSTASESASSSADADAADTTASADADTESADNTGADVTGASSEQMTASSDRKNSTNIDANNTPTDSSANSMAATQNTNQPDTHSASQSDGQSTNQVTRPAINSTASSNLVGTNFDQTMTEPASTFTAPFASNMAGTTPLTTPAETNTAGTQTDATKQDLRLTNGKTPDDIPDADNDSVFEAQIRAAAMAENDPNTKKNLWNEYRRYKGLPEQK